MYEGSLALPYKDLVRTRPDTPLPRTCRGAVVLFVCPQLDRFADKSVTIVDKIGVVALVHDATVVIGDNITTLKWASLDAVTPGNG